MHTNVWYEQYVLQKEARCTFLAHFKRKSPRIFYFYSLLWFYFGRHIQFNIDHKEYVYYYIPCKTEACQVLQYVLIV